VKKKSGNALNIKKSNQPYLLKHSKSIDNLLLNTKVGGVFGVPLAFSLTTEENLDIPKRKIPLTLDLLLTLIENKESEIEGDILVDADLNSPKVLNYIEKFEDGDFRVPKEESATVLCGLLKTFLRKLPEPLIPNIHYKRFIDIIKKHNDDTEEIIKELKTLLKVQAEVNVIATHRILLFLNKLTKSWFTSQEHESKIRNEFVHYILRPRLGSIESGYNISSSKEMKRVMVVYDFLVEHVYEIYGVIEDHDGIRQIFLTMSDKLLIKKNEDNESNNEKKKP